MALESARLQGGTLPSTASLYKIMEIATTSEASGYFYTQFNEVLSKAGLGKNMPAIASEIGNFAENIAWQKESATSPWSGDTRMPSSFQNLHQNLAADAAKTIEKTEIAFHFAISQDSQIIRGYTSDGVDADESTVAAMDKLFNAWLAGNNLISKGGVIYHVDEAGELRQEQGQPLKISSAEFGDLLEDANKGFAQFIHKNNDSINFSLQRHAYPEPTQEAREEEAPTPG
ncbi:hypothetical protein NKV53_05385 [Legionella sp. 27cVA30]|uniref:Type IV secretion protein Dot n=1 Tax=Legionella septentrionalis TaxID=2498109 RepID=A0A3S0XS20_9GAMM|nr:MULTISPECIES: hypothetical protein [Legionella]MCP0913789.1 hypothetical protein [Legionella sp. 27cVA30]RUQ81589.1 hypothetical protein EKM59_10225 [Legionella septentrionalis]RUR14512.1 hypothetical protein ELY10_08320 [Legionella septentrionalis]